jgi:ABC-type transporter Mla MlaB component
VRIATVLELKTLLEKFLSRKQITIDAAKIEKIDTSALQLLTAFILEAGKRSIKVKWQSPSEALLISANLLGLDQHLQLPARAEK